MVRPCIESDPKRSVRNGFTVMEMLIVMLIVGILMSMGVNRTPSASLNLFMKQLQSAILTEQFGAFEEREKRQVRIDRHSFKGDAIFFDYPQGITCSPLTVSYNARGNIAKAGTVNCSDGHHFGKLVFQIGAGRVRLEMES